MAANESPVFMEYFGRLMQSFQRDILGHSCRVHSSDAADNISLMGSQSSFKSYNGDSDSEKTLNKQTIHTQDFLNMAFHQQVLWVFVWSFRRRCYVSRCMFAVAAQLVTPAGSTTGTCCDVSSPQTDPVTY